MEPMVLKKGRSCCIGRSRGGLTTKFYALVDTHSRPILLILTAGQAHNGRSASAILGTLRKGQVLLADRAYESEATFTFRADESLKTEISNAAKARDCSNAELVGDIVF